MTRPRPLPVPPAPPPPTAVRRRGGRGFTLMEVLIALGIFAVGLISVAAVFPTGIAVQRQTVDDLTSAQVARNAEAVLRAMAQSRELSYRPGGGAGTLADYARPTGFGSVNNIWPMVRLPDFIFPGESDQTVPRSPLPFNDPSNSDRFFFSTTALTYPAHTGIDPADPLAPLEANLAAFERNFIWYPLVRASVPQGTTDVANGVSPTWQFFVVVMKTQGELGSLPELRQATVQPVSDSPGRLRITGPSGFDNDVNADNEPDVILPGDTILTRGGRVVRVIAAEDDEIVVNAPDIGNPGLIYYGRTFGEDKSVGATDFLNEGSPIVRVHSFTMRILEPR